MPLALAFAGYSGSCREMSSAVSTSPLSPTSFTTVSTEGVACGGVAYDEPAFDSELGLAVFAESGAFPEREGLASVARAVCGGTSAEGGVVAKPGGAGLVGCA